MIETQSRLPDASPTAVEPTPTSPVHSNGTVTALVTGILEDAQKLVRQQFDMLKTEIQDDLKKSKRAAEYGGLGVVLLTVGAIAFVSAVAWLLHDEFHLAMWASWAITSAIFLVPGAALAAVSYSLLERFTPVPNKSFHALQETLQWKTK